MSTIDNKMSTVTLELQLMQLFTAYETRTKDGRKEIDFFGVEVWDGDDYSDGAAMNSNHMRETAAIALHALLDLGRTRRAHFWAAKFDMEWDDNEELHNRIVALADMSGIEDGNLYDYRTMNQRVEVI